MRLWTADPSILASAPRYEVAFARLDEGERRRAARLRRDIDRRAFVAAHSLLRSALSEVLGGAPEAFMIGAEPKGRPVLDRGGRLTADWHLSLSHTEQRVAVALSDASPVGVDVEAAGRLASDPAGFAHRHFHPEEVAAVEAADAASAARLAVSIWCLKEAYGKALGEGLRIPTRSSLFSVRELIIANYTLPHAGGDKDWQFALFDVHGAHILAAASQGDAAIEAPIDATDWL